MEYRFEDEKRPSFPHNTVVWVKRKSSEDLLKYVMSPQVYEVFELILAAEMKQYFSDEQVNEIQYKEKLYEKIWKLLVQLSENANPIIKSVCESIVVFLRYSWKHEKMLFDGRESVPPSPVPSDKLMKLQSELITKYNLPLYKSIEIKETLPVHNSLLKILNDLDDIKIPQLRLIRNSSKTTIDNLYNEI
jgi:hypothetical protein